MRSIGVVFARRAGIVAAVTTLAVALLSAPAQAATPPDLTGYWINIAAPALPGWALQATNGLSSLHASWHGTAAQGHPHLVGSFNGTLNQAGTAYSGGYDIEESGSHPGSMTITIDSPNQITISFDGGAGGTYTFQRGVAAAMAPATGWCTSASAPGPSCQTDATAMAPGSEALEQSADFTTGEQSASFDVSSTDPSATDTVLATPPATSGTPLHAADCVKVAGQLVTESGSLRVDLNQADWEQIKSESGGPNAVLFAYALLACLETVHAQQANPTAAAVRVSCPVAAVGIKALHGTHKSITFKEARGRVKPPVIVSCTRSHGKLTVHVRARSRHKTLRQLLGKHLLVGIYHRTSAHTIATARVAFANH